MESFPLSALNHYLFCPRRAALIHVEGIFKENVHTVLGNLVHEHADLPGYESQISNIKSPIILWRALPVWSERLGLSGKCDIVEVKLKPNTDCGTRNAETVSPSEIESLAPVEYKKGKRRQFENDDAQLCAQALCLEEMFEISIERGAVFHAASKRRREVVFTSELRSLTEQAIRELHTMAAASEFSNLKFEISNPLPPAVFKPACEECSLFDICLPRITSNPKTVQLFDI